MNKFKAKTTVASIGAGRAGLSYATRLQALGLQVQIYEKSLGTWLSGYQLASAISASEKLLTQ